MKKKNHYKKPLLRIIKHLPLNTLCQHSQGGGVNNNDSRHYRSTWDDKE